MIEDLNEECNFVIWCWIDDVNWLVWFGYMS
jgi:hypothetical protein